MKYTVTGKDQETIDGFLNFIQQIHQAQQPQYSGDAEFYKNMYNEGNEVIGDQTGLLSWWNSKTGRGLTNAQRQANAYDAWQAQVARDYSTEMANTQWQRGTVDMQKAGVNPALVYGNGSTPSGVPSSAQATGVNPGTPTMGFQDLIALMKLPSEIKLLEAQTTKTKADAGKTEKETSWIDRVNEVETKFKEENTNLTREQVENAQVYRREMEQNIKESYERTKNEEVRRELIKAQERLANMQANEIDQLLEVKKLYMEAQTNTEKAQAAYLGIQKAYQKKLIDNGYLDAMADKMAQEAKNLGVEEEEIRQRINLLKENIKTQENINKIRFGNLDSGNIGEVIIAFFSMLFAGIKGR